ncbi:DUF3606 domain-containing protein [Variovorax sp. DT-64]|uniref:DUF3606 domain-containing protein n=1 Tax=Variovorax sp. DT-64 TaxID=3396160 RepID=UPI003F19ECE4
MALMKSQAERVKVIQDLSALERRWQPDPVVWLKEQDNMERDKSKVGGQDRTPVNLSQDDEVRDWAKSLGVTEDELRKAVDVVGNQADDVREYLKK